MTSDLPRLTIRIDKEVIDKLKVVSSKNYRSLNSEIRSALVRYIEDYEMENGEISTKVKVIRRRKKKED